MRASEKDAHMFFLMAQQQPVLQNFPQVTQVNVFLRLKPSKNSGGKLHFWLCWVSRVPLGLCLPSSCQRGICSSSLSAMCSALCVCLGAERLQTHSLSAVLGPSPGLLPNLLTSAENTKTIKAQRRPLQGICQHSPQGLHCHLRENAVIAVELQTAVLLRLPKLNLYHQRPKFGAVHCATWRKATSSALVASAV